MNNAPKIKLHDHTFRVLIPAAEIDAAIGGVASRLNADYAGRETPLFIGVLNGAFMFMAELMKKVEFNCELSFVKLASYVGICSAGKVSELIGLGASIEGRHVVIVEDVVDTGGSMEYLLGLLAEQRPASVEIAAMFFKPGTYKKEFPIKYKAIEVGNEFIVGFGLDYDGLGRNLRDVYVVTDDE